MKKTHVLLICFLGTICFLNMQKPIKQTDPIGLKTELEGSLGIQLTGGKTQFHDYVTGIKHESYMITGSVTGSQFATIDEVAQQITDWYKSRKWESILHYMADGPSGTSFAFKRDHYLSVISIQLDESNLEADADEPLDLSNVPPEKLKYDLEIHVIDEESTPAVISKNDSVPDITLKAYLIPLIISNLVAILLIFICLKWPRAGRIAWIVIFLAAGLFNIYTASTGPQAYLMYGKTAVLTGYKQFIYGIFSEHIALFITLIGSGQLLAGVLLMLKRPLVFLGILGGIIFLLSITPLGIGSAFPCTILMTGSLIILYLNLKRQSRG